MRYLYGASIQGIQNFIFQTNKLKEIIGASEIIENICTNFFQDFANIKPQVNNPTWIQGAAGSIKYIFDSEEQCRKVFLEFPKAVIDYAPGVNITQNVIKIDGPLTKGNFDELETNLKAERNKMSTNTEYGQLATQRLPRTGFPETQYAIKDESQDYISRSKLEAQAGSHRLLSKFLPNSIDKSEIAKFPSEFTEITGGAKNKWLAVIHADGNGLGSILLKLSNSLQGKDESEIITSYRDFSIKLETATVNAAKKALDKSFPRKGDLIPFRPIILGGDDLTVVISADKALQFVKHFLEYFQDETSGELSDFFKKRNLDINQLTACAGIAYIKESYPFHFSVNMADMLCRDAKNESKAIDHTNPPSSVSFYKVQSTFISTDRFESIVNRDLTTQDGFCFKYGPYFLNSDKRININDLEALAVKITKEGAPKTALREWISARYQSKEKADLILDRLIQILELDPYKEKYIDDFKLRKLREDECKSHNIYDLLTIASFIKDEQDGY